MRIPPCLLSTLAAESGPAVTPRASAPCKQAFALVPCEGGVPPGDSVTVKAVFSPDRSRIWPLLGAFRIEARDQVCGGKRKRGIGFA